jgi:glutamate synthase (NADPH/NADH) large chain
LGIRKLTDLIGRTDLLELMEGQTSKQKKLKLDVLLDQGSIPATEPRFAQQDRNPSFDKGELAEKMVSDALPFIKKREKKSLTYAIQNVNRSIGARVSGEIAKAWGNAGLPDDSLHIKLLGSAGQSFGVWNANGLTLELEGDANDYVGKGMNGGRLVIYPPKQSSFEPHRNIIIGNTCLYGATGGELFASGMAGERFGVRNSGAFAVVEGAGDHCCEYMTGGTIIVLGDTGLNFGAGMSGGMAFVYDESEKFATRINRELVDAHKLVGDETEAYRVFLKARIARHAELTGSPRAQSLLANFDADIGKFWLVKPKRVSLEALLDDLPGANKEAVAA